MAKLLLLHAIDKDDYVSNKITVILKYQRMRYETCEGIIIHVSIR